MEGPGWGWRRPGWGPGVAAGIIGGAVIAGAIIAFRPPGYVVYQGYAQPVYAPGCYWASQPVLDPAGRVVGYGATGTGLPRLRWTSAACLRRTAAARTSAEMIRLPGSRVNDQTEVRQRVC